MVTYAHTTILRDEYIFTSLFSDTQYTQMQILYTNTLLH